MKRGDISNNCNISCIINCFYFSLSIIATRQHRRWFPQFKAASHEKLEIWLTVSLKKCEENINNLIATKQCVKFLHLSVGKVRIEKGDSVRVDIPLSRTKTSTLLWLSSIINVLWLGYDQNDAIYSIDHRSANTNRCNRNITYTLLWHIGLNI